MDHRSWYPNENLEGSRFVGEGGHFIDTLSWWFDALPTEVHAVPGRHSDDLHATLRFDDGSVATVDYVTDGSSRFPKETFDVIGGGRKRPPRQLQPAHGVVRPAAGACKRAFTRH